MAPRRRLYDAMLEDHLRRYRQMAMVTGPRQVGKTTTCRRLSDEYLDWDNSDDRRIVLDGPEATAARLGLDRLRKRPPVATFDELHKYRKWKSFLKGLFDVYADRVKLLVTGSSRMDVYRRGGDSLMGRYFAYRMHPFTVGEIAHSDIPREEHLTRSPRRIPDAEFAALWEHGGFPEPFLRRERAFGRRWNRLRTQQLFGEDIRDLTGTRQLDQMEMLASILMERSGDQLVYSGLAAEVQVSVDTLRRWIGVLCGFYVGFLLRPWFRNVARSLRKEPKWFVRDWSGIADDGKRTETLIACHLLKTVEGWTDLGLGDFQVCYIRDKEKREVDFLVVRDRKPWMLVEAKKADQRMSPTLVEYQKQIGAPYAFQAVLDAEFVDADCFAVAGRAVVVPARTLLSQLL